MNYDPHNETGLGQLVADCTGNVISRFMIAPNGLTANYVTSDRGIPIGPFRMEVRLEISSTEKEKYLLSRSTT